LLNGFNLPCYLNFILLRAPFQAGCAIASCFSVLLCNVFCLQVTVLRLPDQGAKLQKQISELNSVLIELRMQKATEREGVISLDDLTGEFERGLNV
jgi:hypothetical protein